MWPHRCTSERSLPAGASTRAHLVGALSHVLQGGVRATVRQKLRGAQNLWHV